MEWPQITYLVLTLMGLGVLLAQHGQPKKGNTNFFLSLFVQCLAYWLLYMGGFFR